MLFFERELDLYVSTVDKDAVKTTANTVKLSVLAGMNITYKQQKQSTYNYKIEATPDRLDNKVVTGYTNPTISFSTYVKPYLDTNEKCAEKLLLEALLGQAGTEGASNYTASFLAANKLPIRYLYIVLGNNLVYYVDSGVVQEAIYNIDIDKATIIDWKVIGLNLQVLDDTAIPDTFTDHTSISNYVLNKLSNISISYDKLPLLGVSDELYLPGNDLINDGVESGIAVNSYGNFSIQTFGGESVFDFGTHNADTGRVVVTSGPQWTGSDYPNDGVNAWCWEADMYWDGSGGGTQNYFWNTNSTGNNWFYYQSYWNGYMYGDGMLAGNEHYDTGTFADHGIAANQWFHVAICSIPKDRTTILYINGKPTSSAWHHTNSGNPGVSSNGFIFGNDDGTTNPWYWGGMKNVAFSYGEDTPKYDYRFTPDSNPVIDGTTIAAVYTDFADEGPNNYTVTNFGATDEGTYLNSAQGSVQYFTMATDSSWNSTDWSINLRMYYNRSSGTYAVHQVYNDNIRRISIINNQLIVYINGAIVLQTSESYNDFATAFQKAAWYYITVEEKDGVYLLYVNGILRSGNASKTTTTPRTISTGGCTFFDPSNSSSHCALQYFRLDNKATRTDSWFESAYNDRFVNGNIPIINGKVKLENKVSIVERDTLDERLVQKLDHYVQDRKVEIDVSGYLKTGSSNNIQNKEIFDLLRTYPDFSKTVDLLSTIRLGRAEGPYVEFTLPKSDIDLPEIKVKDIITDNIKIRSQTLSTIDDDVEIKYKS